MLARTSVMVAWIAVLVLSSAGSGASPEGTPPQYEIQLKLVERGADGRVQVLCAPRLMTLEGQPAVVQVGGEVPAPRGSEVAEPLRYGTSFSVKVFRTGGRLLVDATANVADLSSATDDGVRITTRGLRLVEAITLGKAITVALDSGKPGDGKSRQWELLVRQPDPAEAKASGLPKS